MYNGFNLTNGENIMIHIICIACMCYTPGINLSEGITSKPYISISADDSYMTNSHEVKTPLGLVFYGDKVKFIK